MSSEPEPKPEADKEVKPEPKPETPKPEPKPTSKAQDFMKAFPKDESDAITQKRLDDQEKTIQDLLNRERERETQDLLAELQKLNPQLAKEHTTSSKKELEIVLDTLKKSKSIFPISGEDDSSLPETDGIPRWLDRTKIVKGIPQWVDGHGEVTKDQPPVKGYRASKMQDQRK